MRVAITGSSGLIGTALRRSLNADGHEVLPVIRRTGGPTTIRWDIDRGEIDAAALEGVDAVVHLAGEGIGDKRWTREQKERILTSRTKGTSLLSGALASLSSPPPVLISGSAVGFYGDRGDEVLTEASPRGKGFLADVVVAWEAATEAAEAAGIRVAKIRTGIALDRDGGALGKMAKIARFGVLGKLGSGDQWMSWIALTDHIRAVRFLIERDVRGPVNLTAPNPVTNAELTKALGKAVHRPTVIPVPSFGPKLLLGRELADALLLEGQRVLPSVLLEAGFEFRYPDIEAALSHVFAERS